VDYHIYIYIYISNISSRLLVLAFLLFSKCFRISYIILNFMLLSFVFLRFCFCFLVEVGFLAYLRFCKLSKMTYFIVIILARENKPMNLKFIFTAFFCSSKFCIICLLLSLAYQYHLQHRLHSVAESSPHDTRGYRCSLCSSSGVASLANNCGDRHT